MSERQNVRSPSDAGDVSPDERIVRFRPTTILAVLGIVFGFLLLLYVIWLSRQVLTWIPVSYTHLTLPTTPYV